MFTRTALGRAFARATGDSIRTTTVVEAGKNHAYRITTRDGERRFLKVGTRFPDRFDAEPATMRVVGRETDVPVPAVHATGQAPLGYPFAVSEFVAGSGHGRIRDLPRRTAERLCREAGSNLADLHRLDLPAFGRVAVRDGELTVAEERKYERMLRGSLDRQVGDLRDSPFADRCDRLRGLGSDLLDGADLDAVDPVFVHGDYRLDNLRLDPEGSRVTAAVLDWELPTAGDPLWDAVTTLALLTQGYGVDADAGRSYRTAFWEGYGDPPDADSERWHCCELLARMRLARHLTTETEGLPEAAVSARVAEHRRAFEDLCTGSSRLERSPLPTRVGS
ncbi:phosphotransferase family protein [Halorarum halobium]|uniref:phosphotransferase family protein n=1 Tax=Halorarum halobium TaxID=3075121 RepID=UPI0028AC2EE5|nr:phosphotransferase [Halobaculum sp. XH14]